jgi:hypothetical protein
MCSEELSKLLNGPEDATLEERIAGARVQVVCTLFESLSLKASLFILEMLKHSKTYHPPLPWNFQNL